MEEREYRYGWMMVFLAGLFNGIAVGVPTSIGMFIVPISEDLGWARGDVALAYTVCVIATGIGGIVMGYFADRFATRPIVAFGVVVMAASLYLLSAIKTPMGLYLLFALLGGLGAGAIFTPMITNVGYWFSKNKGLAIGLATAGQAAGQAMVPFSASFLIASHGWRDAFTTLGMVFGVGLLLLSPLIRVPPGHAEAVNKAKNPAATPGDQASSALSPAMIVGWLSIATIFCCITMSTPVIHVASMALDKGFAQDEAAMVFALIGMTAIFGRVLYGKLADHIGGIRTLLVGSTVQTAMVFWFTQIDSVNWMYAMSILFGLGYSGVMTSVTVSVRELMPIHKRGIAIGVLTMFGWIGMGLGGYQGGLLFDLSGSYVWPFGGAVVAGLVNMVLIVALLIRIRRDTPPAMGLAPA
jgi:MFS family permease